MQIKITPLFTPQPNPAFISIYAVILSFSISLVALHSFRNLSIKKDFALSLMFQKQSMLYAKSLKEIALMCLKSYDFDSCKKDSVKFDEYFYGEYALTREKIHDINHQDFNKDILLLDIMIHSKTLLSTHPLKFSKRYILKNYKG